jgi:hypothetical protein
VTCFAIRLTDVLDGQVTWIRIQNPWPGYWLAAYDPDARDGIGEALFVPDENAALRFESFDEAKAFWYQQSTVMPEREGRENRPLTICSIDIAEVAPVA